MSLLKGIEERKKKQSNSNESKTSTSRESLLSSIQKRTGNKPNSANEDEKRLVRINAVMLANDINNRALRGVAADNPLLRSSAPPSKRLYSTSDDGLRRRAAELAAYTESNPNSGIDSDAINKALDRLVNGVNENAVKRIEKKRRIDEATKAATQTSMSLEDIEKNLAESAKRSEDLKKRYTAANDALRIMTGNGNQAFEYSDFYKENEEILKQNLGEFADIEQLNRAIQNADRDVERYESEKRKYQYNEDMTKKYSGLQAQSDFGALAERGKASLPKYSSLTDVRNMSDEDVAALYINSDDDTRRNIRGIYEYSGLLENYDYLDDQQKNTYNAIRASEGEKAGLEYLKFIDPILQRKGYFTQQEDLIAKVDGNAGAAVLENAGTVLTSPLRGVDFLGAAADRAFGLNQDALGSARDYVMNPTKASTIVRSTTQEQIANPTLRFAYNTGMSILDNAMNIAVGGGSQVVSLALMGSGAASQTYFSAKEKGLTEDEALSMGLLSGVLETATESIGLDNLFSIIQKEGGQAGWELVKSIASQIGAEGTEEVLAEFGNAFIDRFVSGDLSDYNLAVQQYMEDGLTADEANKKATSDFFKQVGEAFLSGGLSGGIMGGGAAGINAIANAIEQSRLDKERGRAILDTYGYDNLMKLAEETAKLGEGRQERSLQRTTDRIKGKPNSAHYVEMNPQVATKIYDKATKAEVAQKTRTDDIEQNIKSGTPLKASDVKKVSKAIVSDIVNKKSYSAEKYDKMLDGYTFTDLNEKGESAKRAKILDVIKYQYEQKQAEYNERVKKNAPVSEPVETVVPKAEDLSVSEDGVTRDTDGNEVKIKEIESVTKVDGKNVITYKLDNGRTITNEDIQYASQEEALITESMALVGASMRATQNVLKNFNPSDGISIETYADAAALAYSCGLTNDVASVKKLAGMPLEKGMIAFYQGQHDAGVRIKEQTAKIRYNVRAAEAQAIAEGKPIDKKVGQVKYVGKKVKATSERQRTIVKTVEYLSKLAGVDFYLYKSYEKNGKIVYRDEHGVERSAPNGKYKDGNIYIDLNASNLNQKEVMIGTVAHELTHHIEETAPAKFKVLANLLVQEYSKHASVEEAIQAIIADSAAEGKTLSREKAFSEFVAQGMEDMLTSGEVIQFLEKVKQQDKTLWQKIVDFFKKFAEDIKKMVKAYEGYQSDATVASIVRDMGEVQKQLEQLYAEALVESSENFQTMTAGMAFEGEADALYQAKKSKKELPPSDIRRYNENTYDKYGWAFVNGALNEFSGQQFLKAISETAAGLRSREYNRLGDLVITVGSDKNHYDNVVIYCDDISSADEITVIHDVIVIIDEDKLDIEDARRLLDGDTLQSTDVEFYFGDGSIVQYTREDQKSFFEISRERDGKTGSSGKRSDRGSEEMQKREGGSSEAEGEVSDDGASYQLRRSNKSDTFTEALKSEQEINRIRREISSLEDGMMFASEIERKSARNKILKLEYELDNLISEERRATRKTPLSTILENLGAYRYSDLESIASQLTNDAWDYEEGVSRKELEDGIREIIEERSQEMSALELQAPRYGVWVRDVATENLALFQLRDTDGLSNRNLLANALESAAQNDIERKRIEEYKGKISMLNAEEAKLRDLNDQIKELSFAKGTKDTKRIKDLQFERNQTANRINTLDKSLLKLEATKPLQDVLQREKQKAYKRAEQKGKEALAKYREKAAETQREIITRYQESKKRGIESRKMTEMRGKIKSVVNELNNLLLHGSKDKHIMVGLQKVVAEALDIINMDTVGAEQRIARLKEELVKAKTPEKIQEISRKIDNIQRMGESFQEKMDKLKAAYANIKNSDDPLVANAYDEVIAQRIESVSAIVGNTSLRDMSLEQLGEVYEMYKMVLTTVRNSNKAFKAKRNETISVLANRTMEEIHKIGGTKQLALKALQGMKAFSWNNLKPVYALRAIGSDTFTEAFDNVRAGEDTWAVDVTDAKKFFENISKKYGYKNWDFKKRYGFKSTTGVDFELSLEQILSLYAYSKREQADKHLEKGGFVFDSAIEVTEKKGKLGIPLKYTVNTSTAHNLSKEGLAKIIGTLSGDQKMFVDIMQGYLSDVMGAKGNEVSLEMYGVKLFNEDNYFPLKSAKQFMFEQNESAGEVRIKNSSFSKETVVNASNPIILSNFMDVWANHVNDMAMYHSFVLPLEDFNRIFNYKTPTSANMNTESVKMYMQNAYGTQSVQYIKDLITDLNGGVRSDPRESTGKKLVSRFKKSAVMASASVVVQQPSAVARALALIDVKYFDFNPKLIQHKKLWNEVKKYAPVAIIKEMGRFDTDMGRSTADYIKGDSNFMEKVDDVLSKPAAYADELTWCHIWTAVKRETIAKRKDLKFGSEEFLKAAGERFTEVITKTQVYDSVLARSANMRSKSVFMNMVTSFMAEPTTSINMVTDAIRQGKRGNKVYARKAVGAVYASLILNAALSSIIYAMRDDDEDETMLEKYVSSFTTEVIDSFNPLTYLPFVKDAWSIAQGYDVERADMTLISAIADSLQQAIKVYEVDMDELDDEEIDAYNKKKREAILSVADNVASLLGVPEKNLRRDITAAFNTYKTLTNGLDEDATSMWDEVIESAKNSTPVWGWMKDESKEDKLYKAIMDGDAAYRKRIESQYKDQTAVDNAIRKALRNNDPRIKQAAEAYYNGNIAEYTRIAKAVIADGFKQDIVVKSIMTEVNALKPDEDTDTSSKATGLYKTEAFLQAIMSGDQATADLVRKDLIDTMVANGKTEEEATKSLEGSVSKDCREKFMEGNLTETEAIEVLVNYCGNERDAAEEKVGKWSFEVDYGFSWDDKADAYKNGEISVSELKAVLMDVGGKTAEDADLQVQIYNWQKEVPNCDDITASAIKDYNEYCKPAGITKSVYYNAWRTFEDTPSDYDSNGEAVRYSKTEKVMPKINALPISSEQKTALALCWWAEGTVNKYKLW